MWKRIKTDDSYASYTSFRFYDGTDAYLKGNPKTKYLDARMAFAIAVRALDRIWGVFEDIHDPNEDTNNNADWKKLEWNKIRASSSWRSLNRVLEARQGDFFAAYHAWIRSKAKTRAKIKAKTKKATSTAK